MDKIEYIRLLSAASVDNISNLFTLVTGDLKPLGYRLNTLTAPSESEKVAYNAACNIA